jgi:hypothetical protein
VKGAARIQVGGGEEDLARKRKSQENDTHTPVSFQSFHISELSVRLPESERCACCLQVPRIHIGGGEIMLYFGRLAGNKWVSYVVEIQGCTTQSYCCTVTACIFILVTELYE